MGYPDPGGSLQPLFLLTRAMLIPSHCFTGHAIPGRFDPIGDAQRSPRVLSLLQWWHQHVEPDPSVAASIAKYAAFLTTPSNHEGNVKYTLIRNSCFEREEAVLCWCVGVLVCWCEHHRSSVRPFTFLPAFKDRGRLWKVGGGGEDASSARLPGLFSYLIRVFSSLLFSCRLVLSCLPTE